MQQTARTYLETQVQGSSALITASHSSVALRSDMPLPQGLSDCVPVWPPHAPIERSTRDESQPRQPLMKVALRIRTTHFRGVGSKLLVGGR
jgi:hypothetical protein